jgi:hypothetical protein
LNKKTGNKDSSKTQKGGLLSNRRGTDEKINPETKAKTGGRTLETEKELENE